MKTNVFGYIRVSSRKQIDGDGPERQKEKIQIFCDANDLHLAGCFEESISGTVESAHRPEFCELLECAGQCTSGPAPIFGLVVERMDRLARDLMVSELLLAECRKRNLKVYSTDMFALIDMASNDVDPTRKLIRQIMAALSEWEKSALVTKLRLARERVKAKRGRCEGNLPFGMNNHREAQIKKIMQHYYDSGVSFHGIARQLNEEGFLNRINKPWQAGSIQSILTKRQCVIK